jgi:translation initiation factor IF-2
LVCLIAAFKPHFIPEFFAPMSDVTVHQLAEVLNLPLDRLMAQLGDAGISVSSADQSISNTEKMKLLGFLRRSHGKVEKAEEATPKQITLKRKTVSELKVVSNTGKGSKTVSVEVRARKTYLNRKAAEEETPPTDDFRETARKLLAESEAAHQAKELELRAIEDSRRAEVEAQKRQQEEVERRVREEAERAVANAERAKAEAEEAQRRESHDGKRGKDDRDRSKDKPEDDRSKVKHPKVAVREVDDEAPAAVVPTLPREPSPATRYGRKELHVVESKQGQRRHNKSKPKPAPDRGGDRQHAFSKPTAPVVREVQIPTTISVGDLAQRATVKAGEVIKQLMKMGVMATINQMIDQDTALLVVEELGHKGLVAGQASLEEKIEAQHDSEGELVSRPPVVTIMGHVDHGKTSLLDYIRRTKVAAGEAGGITQHIGAYHVETSKGVVSFLDTPGHAAFTSMRARGAKLTDIVVLVVAADDGVMPQTIEAIQHAKAASVPLIVAMNKMDKADANPDHVRQGLAQHEVIPEEWGGENIFVPVSAKTGMGIDALLDAILVQSEVLELKAPVSTRAQGVVVESSLDKGRGPVATVLVQTGTLRRGDVMLCGAEWGRVRAMFDEAGRQIQEAGPSIPCQVLGLSSTPNAGDKFSIVQDERFAREAAAQRSAQTRDTRLAKQQSTKLENVFSQMGQGEQKSVNLLIKADVQGSVEALRESLTKLSNEEVRVTVVASGVGGITESDAVLAQASNAILVGFNVRADSAARKVIQDANLDINYYSIIYNVIDDVKKAISGKLGTEVREQIIGLAQVKDVFRSSKFGNIAGCLVIEGVVKRMNPIRVLRDNVVVFEGELESLRRFKDMADEVRAGTECGIGVKLYNDVKPGDQIECFERTVVQRTLE